MRIGNVGQRKIAKFSEFVVRGGAEALDPTNPYEIARFKVGDDIGIVYRGRRGVSVTGIAVDAWQAFAGGLEWNGVKPKQKRRALGYVVPELLKRDGDRCVWCGEALGDDITVDHLIPVADGGPNRIENYGLAHEPCNQAMADLPIAQKILRIHEVYTNAAT